jgi:hypothetical protein
MISTYNFLYLLDFFEHLLRCFNPRHVSRINQLIDALLRVTGLIIDSERILLEIVTVSSQFAGLQDTNTQLQRLRLIHIVGFHTARLLEKII